MVLRIVTAIMCSATLLLPAAAEDDCTHRTIPAIAIERLPNDRFEVVTSLDANDLKVVVGGAPATIPNVQHGIALRPFVLVIDTSGSMKSASDYGPDENKWKTTGQLASVLLASLPEDSFVELLAFADGVTVNAGFQKDRQVLKQKLAALFDKGPKGRTRMWDAIHIASNHLSLAAGGGTIFVITDGVSTQGQRFDKALARLMLDRNVRLFAVLFENHERTLEEHAGPEDLGIAARFTGGDTVLVPRLPLRQKEADSISASLEHEVGAVAASNSLSIELQHPLTTWTSVKLSTSDATAHRKIDLLYPHELPPCAKP